MPAFSHSPLPLVASTFLNLLATISVRIHVPRICEAYLLSSSPPHLVVASYPNDCHLCPTGEFASLPIFPSKSHALLAAVFCRVGGATMNVVRHCLPGFVRRCRKWLCSKQHDNSALLAVVGADEEDGAPYV
ncbi:hypothetical protein ACLOJK_004692 [Asimina triloba]